MPAARHRWTLGRSARSATSSTGCAPWWTQPTPSCCPRGRTPGGGTSNATPTRCRPHPTGSAEPAACRRHTDRTGRAARIGCGQQDLAPRCAGVPDSRHERRDTVTRERRGEVSWVREVRAAVVYHPMKLASPRWGRVLRREEQRTGRPESLWVPTRADDDAASLRERLRAAGALEADVLIAAGGDGTVQLVAEAAMLTGQSLGIWPVGSTNLFARNLELPTLDPAASLRAGLGDNERMVDTVGITAVLADGTRTRRTSLVLAGFGVDAQMVVHTSDEAKRQHCGDHRSARGRHPHPADPPGAGRGRRGRADGGAHLRRGKTAALWGSPQCSRTAPAPGVPAWCWPGSAWTRRWWCTPPTRQNGSSAGSPTSTGCARASPARTGST